MLFHVPMLSQFFNLNFSKVDPLGLYLQHMFIWYIQTNFPSNSQVDLHFLDVPSPRRRPWMSEKRGVKAYILFPEE